MAAWHKKEEKNYDRAIDRDGHEQDTLETQPDRGGGCREESNEWE